MARRRFKVRVGKGRNVTLSGSAGGAPVGIRRRRRPPVMPPPSSGGSLIRGDRG